MFTKSLFTAALAAIGVSAFGFDQPAYDATYTTNGITYAQRGGLGVKDFVVTNIDAGAVGKVKSVNGRVGDVLLDAAAVNALPDSKDELVSNENFKDAVATVSPPVELPQKWALANVTNANGKSVRASDVGALSISRTNTDQTFNWSPSEGGVRLFGTHYGTGIGLSLNSRGGQLFNYHDDTYDWYQLPTGESGTLALKRDISATNPTFSNAVLAVGLNIDTNSVAVLNEIADTFGGFPIGGTATTVGGLLAALAAAIAWLKKNKVGSFASVGGASATVENGVAKLDDFFTNSNSLLMGTIDARLPYPLYSVPSTGELKDRAINTTSLASVTVPDNFTDLLIRASVATSLPVTMPDEITKYGDTFPSEAGEYLITITKTGAAEVYVRTIKLEVAQ